MEWLTNFKELGIAGIAVAGLCFVLYLEIKRGSKNETDYRSFVQDNNHTTTELVRECTASIIESTNTMKAHNAINEAQNQILKNLLERVK